MFTVLRNYFNSTVFFFLHSGGIKCNCGQVHRRECSFDSWDVQLCSWPPAMYHLYGWNWCYRCVNPVFKCEISQLSPLLFLHLYSFTLDYRIETQFYYWLTPNHSASGSFCLWDTYHIMTAPVIHWSNVLCLWAHICATDWIECWKWMLLLLASSTFPLSLIHSTNTKQSISTWWWVMKFCMYFMHYVL